MSKEKKELTLKEAKEEFLSKLDATDRADVLKLQKSGDSLVEELAGDDEEKQGAIAEAMTIIGMNLGTIQVALGLDNDQMHKLLDHVLQTNKHAIELADKYDVPSIKKDE